MNIYKETSKSEKLKFFRCNIRIYDKKNMMKRWTENLKDTYKKNDPKLYEDIITGEIMHTPLKRRYKWKSPEMDKITNFCPPLPYLSSSHYLIAKSILEIIKEPEKCPGGSQKE